MTRPVRLGAVLAVAICTLSAAPASATFPGALGRIAYHSGGGEHSMMWVDEPSDDEPAVAIGRGTNPVWSPDGTKIAYEDWSHCELHQGGSSTCPAPSGIGIVNADGSSPRTIASTPLWGSKEFETDVDMDPVWAADGQSVYYFRYINGMARPGEVGDHWELRRASVGGSDARIARHPMPDDSGLVNRGVMSPDGKTIAAVRWSAKSEVVLLSVAGGALGSVPGTQGASGVDWAPDGRTIAVSGLGPDRDIAKVMTPGGFVIQDPFPTSQLGSASFTPDGSRLVTALPGQGGEDQQVAERLVGHLLEDPEADIPDYEPQAKPLGALPAGKRFALQPQRQPIIFVHGFAGSKIACGSDELWLPTLGAASRDLLDMRLDIDGASPHPLGCAAQATAILAKAYGLKDVYQSTLDYLEGIAPDDHHVFVWDWRKDPLGQLEALDVLLEKALDQPLQKSQGVKKVALVGHSMGGLLIRGYIDDPSRAARVARVVTVGTPYWGSPKAILPLVAGFEAPGWSVLDALLPNEALRELFRNLTGGYFLYPSDRYGGWLTVNGRTPAPLDHDGLLRYVFDIGGSSSLLARGLKAHADVFDEFKRNHVDYRVFVGTGLNTVGAIRLAPGEGGAKGTIDVRWVNGDGTVPSRSATQGNHGLARGADGVPLSYVCGIDHVPLAGHAKVLDPLRDFLLNGAQPRKTRQICLNSGTELRFTGITLAEPPSAGSSAARALDATPGLRDAEAAGKLQLLEFPDEPIAVADDANPVEVTEEVDGARIAITRLRGEDRNAPRYYGPVHGQLRLQTAPDGSIEVLDDGQPVAARTTWEKGDPGTGTGDTDTGDGGDSQPDQTARPDNPNPPRPDSLRPPPGPTAAALRAALSADARRAARRLARVGPQRLSRRGGTRLTGLTALTSGTFTLTLTGPTPKRARRTPRVLAKGSRAVATAGPAAVELKLTSTGTHTLRRARRLMAKLTLDFRAAAGTTARVTATVALKRRR